MKKNIWITIGAIVVSVLSSTVFIEKNNRTTPVHDFNGDFGYNHIAASNFAYITGQVTRFTTIDGDIVYCYGRINGEPVTCYGTNLND